MGAIDERVLERIRRDAGATNVGLLASDLRLKFPTVQKAVDRLIKTGRVERTEDGGLTTTIAEAREHAFDVEADRRYKAAVQSMPRRHATRKASAQLQREIDEALGKSDKAIDTVHTLKMNDGRIITTTWHDTRAQAQARIKATRGRDPSKDRVLPGGVLGKFRAITWSY